MLSETLTVLRHGTCFNTKMFICGDIFISVLTWISNNYFLARAEIKPVNSSFGRQYLRYNVINTNKNFFL